MSEKYLHKRQEDEDFAVEHRRSEDFSIPDSAKWIAAFINRIGFPIFAFCLLSYFYFVGLRQNTEAINGLKDVMIQVKTKLEK